MKLPTPVRRLEALESGTGQGLEAVFASSCGRGPGGALESVHAPSPHGGGTKGGGNPIWVKHDDLTASLYGGNKVRKLEYILRQARDRGVSRLVTVGAVGSHHVLATALYGRLAGFSVEAILVPQPRTEHVVSDIRASLGQGLVAWPVRAWAHVPLSVMRRLGRDAMWIPAGGSSVDGALGYVAAVRELADQVSAGECPEPDWIVTTLGSGGTVAGLAAGVEMMGMKSRVLAVCVAEPPAVIEPATVWLAWKTAEHAGVKTSLSKLRKRIVVERKYLGAGYGKPTAWGTEAISVGHSLGLILDQTYTAKAFAAVIERSRDPRSGVLLYWHTLSSAPLAPLLQSAPTEQNLPAGVRALIM